ncbi:MAG: SPFH domain-containing protein [Anaerolineaceae bacterium]|nr:MAG: SPFH domain-containing protein [Anaerolineaceae bacterium]
MTTSQPSSTQQRSQGTSSRKPSRRTLFSLFLIFLLICYWLFVWRLERIDPADYQLPIALPLPLSQLVVAIRTLFLPRVLLHFLPLLLGFLLAFEMASNLLFYLYDLPDRMEARRFLVRLRSPGRFLGKDVTIKPQNLEKLRRESARLRAGGPGRVNIPVGHVAITEKNGRYFRAIDAGNHILSGFEYVKAILDLRPQQRNCFKVRLRSKEGLEVTTDASVTFRIGSRDNQAAPRQPYPFDANNVRKLVYAVKNLPEDHVSSWEGSALSTVVGALRKLVATFSLDDLLPDSQTGAHKTISRQAELRAASKLNDEGIDLQRVRIGSFRFPEDVSTQRLEVWSTFWNSRAELARADGEGVAIVETEIAKAAARMEMIQSIVAAVQQAQQQGSGGIESVIVALRLVEALQNLARQSGTDVSLPAEMLPQLQSLQQQLLLSSNLSDDNGNSAPDTDDPIDGTLV